MKKLLIKSASLLVASMMIFGVFFNGNTLNAQNDPNATEATTTVSNKTMTIAAYAPRKAESAKFWITNPDNPEDKKEITLDHKPNKIPANWKLSAEIIMNPTWVLYQTGIDVLKLSDFEVSSTGLGNQAKLKYTLKDFDVKANIELSAWGYHQFNYAVYRLNGGVWNDKDADLASEKNGYYQIFITPYGTVYEPNNPTKEGYTFIGWTGTSKLEKEANEKNQAKRFTLDNLYDFTETDPNIAVKYIRGGIVKLYANWAKLPTLELEDVIIFEGEDFTPSDLVVSAKDYKDRDLLDPENGDITYTGDYDNNTIGTYPIEVTTTDKLGGTVTKKANLIVKKRWTPILAAPILEVEDKTITVGDELDLKTLITKAEDQEDGPNLEDNVQIIPGDFDNKTPGVYEVTYILIDKDGLKVTKTATVTVVEANVDPSEPTEPSQPVDPSEPTEPSQPVDPSEPTEPSQTVDPSEPTEPSQPSNQVPTDNPAPEESTDPEVGRTGEVLNASLIAGPILMILAAAIAITRRKKEQNED